LGLVKLLEQDHVLGHMRGLFIGRFQPLHRGHTYIMQKALEEVDHLIVGIGSAERSHTSDDPFTAGERVEMVLRASEELGITDRVIPLPVRDMDRYAIWVAHVVSLVPHFDVVYSNNPLTSSLFRDSGYEVRETAMVERKELSGVNIRGRIREGSSWEDLVPSSVRVYLSEIDGIDRIREGDLSWKTRI